MKNTKILAVLLVMGATVAVGGYLYVSNFLNAGKITVSDLDPTPRRMTVSGTYVCLPHLDTSGPRTTECAFGLKADTGDYYAINFGASASAAEQFNSGAHVTVEGFFVIKEALNTDQWKKYNMKGIFTVTNVASTVPVQGKLNITVVCEEALSYMTFVDGARADAFVADCKAGKHPEVMEQYKIRMNLGDGATI